MLESAGFPFSSFPELKELVKPLLQLITARVCFSAEEL
jgi:hypothetical protein